MTFGPILGGDAHWDVLRKRVMVETWFDVLPPLVRVESTLVKLCPKVLLGVETPYSWSKSPSLDAKLRWRLCGRATMGKVPTEKDGAESAGGFGAG